VIFAHANHWQQSFVAEKKSDADFHVQWKRKDKSISQVGCVLDAVAPVNIQTP
jgi:hypothetical protein